MESGSRDLSAHTAHPSFSLVKVPATVPAVSNPREGVWCPIPGPFFNKTLTGDYSEEYEEMLQSSCAGHNGQACFWFSNGCSHGCPACDGTTRGPGVHNHKVMMMIMN